MLSRRDIFGLQANSPFGGVARAFRRRASQLGEQTGRDGDDVCMTLSGVIELLYDP